jgi:hypothetical protein
MATVIHQYHWNKWELATNLVHVSIEDSKSLALATNKDRRKLKLKYTSHFGARFCPLAGFVVFIEQMKLESY